MDILPQQPTQEPDAAKSTLEQIETVAASSGPLVLKAADASLGPDPIRRQLPPQNPLARFS